METSVRNKLQHLESLSQSWADCARLVERSQPLVKLLEEKRNELNHDQIEELEEFINCLESYVLKSLDKSTTATATAFMTRQENSVDFSHLNKQVLDLLRYYQVITTVDYEKLRTEDLDDQVRTFSYLFANSLKKARSSADLEMLRKDVDSLPHLLRKFLAVNRHMTLTVPETTNLSKAMGKMKQQIMDSAMSIPDDCTTPSGSSRESSFADSRKSSFAESKTPSKLHLIPENSFSSRSDSDIRLPSPKNSTSIPTPLTNSMKKNSFSIVVGGSDDRIYTKIRSDDSTDQEASMESRSRSNSRKEKVRYSQRALPTPPQSNNNTPHVSVASKSSISPVAPAASAIDAAAPEEVSVSPSLIPEEEVKQEEQQLQKEIVERAEEEKEDSVEVVSAAEENVDAEPNRVRSLSNRESLRVISAIHDDMAEQQAHLSTKKVIEPVTEIRVATAEEEERMLSEISSMASSITLSFDQQMMMLNTSITNTSFDSMDLSHFLSTLIQERKLTSEETLIRQYYLNTMAFEQKDVLITTMRMTQGGFGDVYIGQMKTEDVLLASADSTDELIHEDDEQILDHRNTLSSQRKVSMKIIRNIDNPLTSKVVNILENEMIILQLIGSHSNILNCYGFIPTDSTLEMIFEYSPYGSMDYLLKQKEFYSQLTLPLVLSWLSDLINGIVFLHQHQIHHHDIRPENFFLFHGLRGKLSYFGTIQQDYEDNSDNVVGYPYMAPELREKRGKSVSRASTSMKRKSSGLDAAAINLTENLSSDIDTITMASAAETVRKEVIKGETIDPIEEPEENKAQKNEAFAADIYSFAVTAVYFLTHRMPSADNMKGQIVEALMKASQFYQNPNFVFPAEIRKVLHTNLSNAVHYDSVDKTWNHRPSSFQMKEIMDKIMEDIGGDPRKITVISESYQSTTLKLKVIEKSAKNVITDRINRMNALPHNSINKSSSYDETSLARASMSSKHKSLPRNTPSFYEQFEKLMSKGLNDNEEDIAKQQATNSDMNCSAQRPISMFIQRSNELEGIPETIPDDEQKHGEKSSASSINSPALSSEISAITSAENGSFEKNSHSKQQQQQLKETYHQSLQLNRSNNKKNSINALLADVLKSESNKIAQQKFMKATKSYGGAIRSLSKSDDDNEADKPITLYDNHLLELNAKDKNKLSHYLRSQIHFTTTNAIQTADILVKNGISNIFILQKRLLKNPECLLDLGIETALSDDIVDHFNELDQQQGEGEEQERSEKLSSVSLKSTSFSSSSIKRSSRKVVEEEEDGNELKKLSSRLSSKKYSSVSFTASKDGSVVDDGEGGLIPNKLGANSFDLDDYEEENQNVLTDAKIDRIMSKEEEEMEEFRNSINMKTLSAKYRNSSSLFGPLPSEIARLYYDASQCHKTDARNKLVALANQGDRIAQGFLMRLIVKGQCGAPKSLPLAQEIGNKIFPYYQSIVAKSNAKGNNGMDLSLIYIHYLLGVCYSEGLGTSKNDKEAIAWYKLSAELGNYSGAQAYLGYCYYQGIGIPKNYNEAIKYYKLAAEQGNAGAQSNLGYCYENGFGVPINYREAIKWYTAAAQQNEVAALYNLGYCYEKGYGVPSPNITEAYVYYLKAANFNYTMAEYKLGMAYSLGFGITTERDDVKAFEYYSRAATKNYAPALCDLGLCYENGKGCEKDMKKAFDCYFKAGEQGHAIGLFYVGYCYMNNLGLDETETVESPSPDLLAARMTEGIKYYKLAAEKRYPPAMNNLGFCYFSGIGVTKNYSLAFSYYRAAAELGYAPAQYNLGYCYEKGFGVVSKLQEMLKWYTVAAENGSEKAMKALKRIQSK